MILLILGLILLYLIAIVANYEYFNNNKKDDENERLGISKSGHENKR